MDDSKTTLDDLPVELMVGIFEQLDSSHLTLASEVTQEWHDIIDRLIGFDVQINPETISKNSVKVYKDLLQIKMDEVTHRGIRGCTVGENFSSDGPHKYSLKYPFLLKNISFGGPAWPSYFEGLLIQKVPKNLSTLNIMLNSMVLPMEDILTRLYLPNLKTLKLKDTGVVVPERKMKPGAIRNAIRNIKALLSVRFPSLKKFSFELIQTATALSIEEEIGLTRGIFSFLGFNRATLLDLKLRLFKRHVEVGDQNLARLAEETAKGACLRMIDLYLTPYIDNTALESTLTFLQGQHSLQRVSITGDKVPFGYVARSLAKNSFNSLTEVQMSKRFLPAYGWDPGYSLDCKVFENCHHLRTLCCQIVPKNQVEKIQINDADCIGVGFYPIVSNTKYLPASLEHVTLESFAIPRAEMVTLLLEMPQLREAYILGNWVGAGYGPSADLLKMILGKRLMQETILGPFISNRELSKGFSNGDLDSPKTIKLTENCQYIHLTLNENDFYESA